MIIINCNNVYSIKFNNIHDFLNLFYYFLYLKSILSKINYLGMTVAHM